MHSNKSSDGEFSPERLMRFCAGAKIRAAALTDHNSVRGVEEAMRSARGLGVGFIPGVELDCTFEDTNLHLLGYGIDVLYWEYARIEKDIEIQEQTVSIERIRLVREMGITVDHERVMGLSVNGVVTGEMIIEAALLDASNIDNPVLSPYRPGGDRGENPYVNFYWDHCAKGGRAYVPVKYIGLEDAVAVIKKSGGVPVLAHPGNNIGKSGELLSRIINAGVEGVEVYSSYHDGEAIDFYNQESERLNILRTVGSDFHGKVKPSIGIGSVSCDGFEKEIYCSLTAAIEKAGGYYI